MQDLTTLHDCLAKHRIIFLATHCTITEYMPACASVFFMLWWPCVQALCWVPCCCPCYLFSTTSMPSCFEMKPRAQKGTIQAHIAPQYSYLYCTADVFIAIFETRVYSTQCLVKKHLVWVKKHLVWVKKHLVWVKKHLVLHDMYTTVHSCPTKQTNKTHSYDTTGPTL